MFFVSPFCKGKKNKKIQYAVYANRKKNMCANCLAVANIQIIITKSRYEIIELNILFSIIFYFRGTTSSGR